MPLGNPNEQVANIPFGSIIGAPLKAAVDAQALAALSTVEFINKVGFNHVETKDPTTGTVTSTHKEVIYVTFSYEKRLTAAGVDSLQTFKLSVPALTIIPIPFIRIEELNLSFKASITMEDNTKDQVQSNKESTIGGKAGGLLSLLNVGFNAGYSSKKDSTATKDSKYSVEYTMDINVHATQDSLPAGLSRILNILETNIYETKSGDPKALTQ